MQRGLKTFFSYLLVCAAASAATITIMRMDAKAPPPAQTGIVEQPCLPSLSIPAELANYRQALVDPATISLPTAHLSSQAVADYRAMLAERAKSDWANLCQYRESNTKLKAGPSTDVVFIGDSITENWLTADPAFFEANGYINRGIGGQTTPQILLRFRVDVIGLNPKVVHILAGVNDIAGNTGPTTLAAIQGNLESMVEMARANNIEVVLGTVLPAAAFPWRPELRPAQHINDLNSWIRSYAARENIQLIDYEVLLSDGEGDLKRSLTHDGVHPHRAGYGLMAPLAHEAVQLALAKKK